MVGRNDMVRDSAASFRSTGRRGREERSAEKERKRHPGEAFGVGAEGREAERGET